MKAALIALLVSVIFAIIGAFVYSGVMEKMAKEKNVQQATLKDVKSGKVKPPADEYAIQIAD